METAFQNAPRLAGSVAVVTGSAAGIGWATCELFAAHGATVIGLDIDPRGRELEDSLNPRYGQGVFTFIEVDVADRRSITSVASEVTGQYGHIDVLFNNAGILGRFDKDLEEWNDDEWDRLVAVNLSGVIFCTKAFLPGLKKSGRGSIIHNASVDAILGNPRAALYSATKGALVPLTHVLAGQFAKHNIRVNCVAPGGCTDGVTRNGSMGIAVTSAYKDQLTAATPLGRPGRAAEVAAAVLFLASDESSFVNGVVIPIDGGRIGLTPGTP